MYTFYVSVDHHLRISNIRLLKEKPEYTKEDKYIFRIFPRGWTPKKLCDQIVPRSPEVVFRPPKVKKYVMRKIQWLRSEIRSVTEDGEKWEIPILYARYGAPLIKELLRAIPEMEKDFGEVKLTLINILVWEDLAAQLAGEGYTGSPIGLKNLIIEEGIERSAYLLSLDGISISPKGLSSLIAQIRMDLEDTTGEKFDF